MNRWASVLLPVVVLAAAAGWLAFPGRPAAGAPAPPPQAPAKWEYGTVTTTSGPLTRASWEVGGERVVGDGWKELAEKAKLPVKGDTVGRGDVLNALGAQGWELVSHAVTGGGPGGGSGHTYTFKRRVP